MNYYNPYFTGFPTSYQTQGLGLSGLLGRMNLSSILNGAQKTLNIVNQTIPIIKEAAPMMKNAKTMFRVMNEFKKIDLPHNKQQKEVKINNPSVSDITNYKVPFSSKPTFFA